MSIRKPYPRELNAFNAIKKHKNKFGVYHKTCFHVHTPASYDYKLFGDWDNNRFSESSVNEIWNECVSKGIFNKYFTLELIQNDTYCLDYTDAKEYLSYLILAQSIIRNKIELVLVTDHNTISGVEKLRLSLKRLCNMKGNIFFPQVVLGIEISCADKNHIVGIFNKSNENTAKINTWLSENLLSEKDGSYETSVKVLEFIESLNGIGYIAHIDTSDIFKDSYLSGAYKKKLFSNKRLKLIGLSKYENKGKIKSYLNRYHRNDIKFILDNDSHQIDDIGNSTFWIKGHKCNFSMIKEAVEDFDISVSFNKEKTSNNYIEGIYISDSKEGFLNNGDGFCLTFSKALNCIIGGRGTGKSTILQILEYVLSQKFENTQMLDFICRHGDTWVLYKYKGEEYLIKMSMPNKKHHNENIMRYFDQSYQKRYWDNYKFNYRHEYNYNKEEIQKNIFRKYLIVSKIIRKGKDVYLENVPNKRELLRSFFDMKYSINGLVNTASGSGINSFIYDTLFENKVLSNPGDTVKFRKIVGLKRALDDTQGVLKKRKLEVEEIINPFNDSQLNRLRITYTQHGYYEEPNIDMWIFQGHYNVNGWFLNYNIKNQSIIDYLLNLCGELGLFEFLKLLLNKDIAKAQKIDNILNYCEDTNEKMIDSGITTLTSTNIKDFLKMTFEKAVSDDSIIYIRDYLKKYLKNSEQFDLEFNINNMEGSNVSASFIPVEFLSLGQKVVAMLSFILGYSEYSNDHRPLIIDQPEDNLDNRYIYKNLVEELRYIKENRQVIIATHNATIVTNAKADQVCVMSSDNEHGRVFTTGYPGENRIKNHIINLLEGGKDSFIHKAKIYEDALKIKFDEV